MKTSNLIFKTTTIENTEFGDGNILCTKVKFSNENTGKIIVGNGNLFEDCVEIINKTSGVMTIGNNNHFYTKCKVYSTSIGDGNVIGVRSELGLESEVGDNCCIAMGSRVPPGTRISKGTWFNGQATDNNFIEYLKMNNKKHVEYLMETLPKYHDFK
jgi:carbonic anhydrase/acetyltransferase-like protein (isoleucine patch superfamily)